MNLHRGASLALRGRSRLALGFSLLSFGIIVATAGGSWDISNHLLNRPETFFAPPHGVLYLGIASALAGAIMAFLSERNQKKSKAVKLSVAGIAILVVAGPADYQWHSAFGLDGLLSPSHLVLVSGMVIASFGALMGTIQLQRRSQWQIALSTFPLWLSLTGIVYMFTLPFSNTNYFNFNPDPTAAAVLASTALPFLISAILCTSFVLSKRRFGVISLVGAAFVIVTILTSILPNGSLLPTIPFYLLNMIPVVAADALASLGRSSWYMFAAGAILAASFLTLYYPLVTHTYNKAMTPQRAVWPSETAPIYFDLLPSIIQLAIVPAIVSGLVGAFAALKVQSKVM